jgi:5'-nucleotidase
VKILLTNDDGIHAPGIRALHGALRDTDHPDGALGEVFTVAPASAQSATSHGITYHLPLMVEETTINGDEALAVEGRPADCTKLALTNLYPDRYGGGARPDLVVSGMNAGANCGINVLYSGTVAAAIEAAFIGVPAIAVSLHIDRELDADRGSPDYERAAKVARRVIDRLVLGGLPGKHEMLSINIPATGRLVEDPEIVVCPMNTHAMVDRYDERRTPHGRRYYWSAGSGLDFHGADEGTDVPELLKGNVTVTPLLFDLTAHDRLAHWNGRLAPATRP